MPRSPRHGTGGAALAAVTAEVDGPAAGLAVLDDALPEGDALRFQPAHVTRAHLLERLGCHAEAVAAYDTAISLTPGAPERHYLKHRRDRAARRGLP